MCHKHDKLWIVLRKLAKHWNMVKNQRLHTTIIKHHFSKKAGYSLKNSRNIMCKSMCKRCMNTSGGTAVI